MAGSIDTSTKIDVDHVLVRGAAVPPGYEPMESWEEGIEPAKVLGYLGEAVAHGLYCAFDPTSSGILARRGCSAPLATDGQFCDHILVTCVGLRKVAQELRLEDFKMPVVPTLWPMTLWRSPLAELNNESCGVDSLRKAIGSGDTAISKGTSSKTASRAANCPGGRTSFLMRCGLLRSSAQG